MKTILLLLVLAASAHGRIGETFDQCVTRYGPSLNDYGVRVFEKAGFRIGITFHEGKADVIAYKKMKKNIIGTADEISENEIIGLLQINAVRPWRKRQIISMDREWETEEGDVLAFYGTMDHQLMVATKAALERLAAAKKAEEDKRLKGL